MTPVGDVILDNQVLRADQAASDRSWRRGAGNGLNELASGDASLGGAAAGRSRPALQTHRADSFRLQILRNPFYG
jgi:hypothetical protein